MSRRHVAQNQRGGCGKSAAGLLACGLSEVSPEFERVALTCSITLQRLVTIRGLLVMRVWNDTNITGERHRASRRKSLKTIILRCLANAIRV